MKFLGNLIWLIFGGLVFAILWFLLGVLLCITIIGTPFGKQCFKVASLMLTPFGKVVRPQFGKHPIMNLIWAIFFGWEIAVGCVTVGVVYCATIIGIPFGLQFFKFALLALMPFGAKV